MEPAPPHQFVSLGQSFESCALIWLRLGPAFPLRQKLETINLFAWQWKTRHNLYFACGVQLVAACCVSMWSLLCIYVTHTHTPVHINSYRKHATKYCSMVWTRKLRNVYAETPWLYAAVHNWPKTEVSKPPVNTHVTVLAFTFKKLNSLPTADLKRLAYLQRT